MVETWFHGQCFAEVINVNLESICKLFEKLKLNRFNEGLETVE